MNDTEQFTVMGPCATSSYHMLASPALTQDTDRAQWLEGVREWMQTVIDRSEGGNTRAKGAAEKQVMILYHLIHVGNKEKSTKPSPLAK